MATRAGLVERGLALTLLALLCSCGGARSSLPAGPRPDADIAVRPGETIAARTALPFDPHRGPVAAASDALAKIIGHPVVPVLTASQSAEEKARLEADVAASLRVIAADLAELRREDPEVGRRSERLERIVASRAVRDSSTKVTLSPDGERLEVVAGFDGYPVLQPGSVRASFCGRRFDADLARFKGVDPSRLSAADQRAWFDHVTCTEPDWALARAQQLNPNLTDPFDARAERVPSMLRLASVVANDSPLDHRVRRFLIDAGRDVGESTGGLVRIGRRIMGSFLDPYEAWLERTLPRFDPAERLAFARIVFDREPDDLQCLPQCGPASVFPRFDRFAFGMSLFDQWKGTPPPSPKDWWTVQPSLRAIAVCRTHYEREPPGGCSAFFHTVMADPADRKRLFAAIHERHEVALLEAALLNGEDLSVMVDLLDSTIKEDALFDAGFRLLGIERVGFRLGKGHQPLEDAAPRWLDTPHRGQALYVLVGSWGQHKPGPDDPALRFVAARHGQLVDSVWLEQYLEQGVRATEQLPKLWPALEKTKRRDDVIARSIRAMMDANRWIDPLRGIAAALCAENDAYGFAVIGAELDRWVAAQPDKDPRLAPGVADDFTCRGMKR